MQFKVVRPIPIRIDPGNSGLKGTFLLGNRVCNKILKKSQLVGLRIDQLVKG